MAMLPDVFKAKDHKAMDDFSPIPAGEYNAQIIESEMKDTQAGTGKYLQMKIKILDGKEMNRIYTERLNLINPNPIAVEIAQKALKSLCDACGKPTIKDSMELHGIPFKMTLKVTPAKGDYGEGNQASNYQKAGGAKAAGGNPFGK